MIIDNSWVGYLDRSYNTIKNSLLSKVTTSNPELTDHSESNIFVIIISMFSGVTEMVNYYIDNMAREGFMSTAQRRSSVIRHSYLLDYRVRALGAESADVTFTFMDNSVETILPSPVVVPLGSTITSSTDGKVYITVEDFTVPAGVSEYVIPFKQVTKNNDIFLGTTDGSKNQQFQLPSNYVHNTSVIKVNSVTFDRKETWAISVFDSLEYIVEVTPENAIVVELGDGLRGAQPTTGVSVTGTFETTEGVAGRVPANDLITSPVLTLPGTFEALVTNKSASSGGEDIEDTESIRTNAIYHRRDNDRMVTRGDYKRLIEAVPGVAAAGIKFCCAKLPDIFILPTGGGLASQILIDDVVAEIELKRMAGLQVDVFPAGETFVVIFAKVFAVKSADLAQVKSDVETNLVAFGSAPPQTINSPVRLSDITTVIDGTDGVSYVELDEVYLKPYAKPTNHSTPLLWDPVIGDGSTEVVEWSLSYTTGAFAIIKDTQYIGDIAEDVEYDDGIIKFTIDSVGAYTTGETWTFITQPKNKSIQLEDFSVPTIILENITLEVATETEAEIC